MFGAILGDIIGSPYEFDRNNIKVKKFPLFSPNSKFTDDTVMTIAVASAFLKAGKNASDEKICEYLVREMQRFGHLFPFAGYGNRFFQWLGSSHPQPYHSYGNGSAMRVSSVAWLYNNVEDVRHAARLSAMVTHNHPEGIKGAEATASAIFLARKGYSKLEIKKYIETEFNYSLNRTCDEIRQHYRHVESCMASVPEAITAFLEGHDFEDVIRTAVSLGGDSDTIAAIAGSIAEGFYGISIELKEECRKRLPHSLLEVLNQFEKEKY